MSVISDSWDETDYAFGWPPPLCLPPAPAAAARTPADAVGRSEEEATAAAVAVAAVTQAMAAAVRVALRAAEALAAASAHPAVEARPAAPARRVDSAAANRAASKALSGTPESSASRRPESDFGAVIVANDGERVYAVESRRDVEPGPFGLPWRSRFRLAAYDDAGVEAWAFAAPPDDVVSDVAVHPSGDVTVAVLRYAPERMAYDLRPARSRRHAARRRPRSSEPQTDRPPRDFGAVDPRPIFRMKSDFADATVGGWVRLAAGRRGLDRRVPLLRRPPRRPSAQRPLGARPRGVRLASERLRGALGARRRGTDTARSPWPGPTTSSGRTSRRCARSSRATTSTGDLLVGRAWNNTRCQANVAVFEEFTDRGLRARLRRHGWRTSACRSR